MAAAASLASALLAFQKDPPPIHSDSTGNFNNKFASLAGINTTVRPFLNDNGLVIVQQPCAIDGQPGLRTTLIHAESGESMEAEMLLILDKQNPQGLGSALTYARRYAVLAILNLVADADDDANAASQPRKKAASPAPAEAGEPPVPPKSPYSPPEGAIPDAATEAQRKLMHMLADKLHAAGVLAETQAATINTAADDPGTTKQAASGVIDTLKAKEKEAAEAVAA
ncbi:MAG: ERF family protein [Gemmatimonadaceae bacterium]|nr:ERF family protein [Gemmatimonadaceae bacterium]